MIKKTKFWINELRSNIDFIAECINQQDLDDEVLADLEKRIMISCYIVRKLVESKKIETGMFHSEITLNYYSKNDKELQAVPSFDVYEYYEKSPTIIGEKFSFVLNQIIHSYYFEFLSGSNDRISGFCFNSDRSKRKGIYLADIEDFFESLTSVTEVYAGQKTYIKNSDGKWIPRW